jgi:hypothetical protein
MHPSAILQILYKFYIRKERFLPQLAVSAAIPREGFVVAFETFKTFEKAQGMLQFRQEWSSRAPPVTKRVSR